MALSTLPKSIQTQLDKLQNQYSKGVLDLDKARQKSEKLFRSPEAREFRNDYYNKLHDVLDYMERPDRGATVKSPNSLGKIWNSTVAPVLNFVGGSTTGDKARMYHTFDELQTLSQKYPLLSHKFAPKGLSRDAKGKLLSPAEINSNLVNYKNDVLADAITEGVVTALGVGGGKVLSNTGRAIQRRIPKGFYKRLLSVIPITTGLGTAAALGPEVRPNSLEEHVSSQPQSSNGVVNAPTKDQQYKAQSYQGTHSPSSELAQELLPSDSIDSFLASLSTGAGNTSDKAQSQQVTAQTQPSNDSNTPQIGESQSNASKTDMSSARPRSDTYSIVTSLLAFLLLRALGVGFSGSLLGGLGAGGLHYYYNNQNNRAVPSSDNSQ